MVSAVALNLQRLKSALGTFVLDALFPLTCVSCSRIGKVLCSSCHTDLLRDAWPTNDVANVYSCFAYAHPAVRKLLTRYKYGGEDAAGESLLVLLQERLHEAKFFSVLQEVEGVVAIPLKRRKFLERGFNQAEVIARMVAFMVEAPLLPGLDRLQDSGQLAGKTAQERKAAMDHSPFVATGSWPKTVLLVDDVYTTGATATAAIAALQSAGVVRVVVFTYARGALH